MIRALVACSLLLAALPAQAAVQTFALVVGVNSSIDPGVERLRYADDDAAKYARLFDRLADRTTLLTLFDDESRLVYKDLAARARTPDRAGLEGAVKELREATARAHAAGDQVVVYFAYVGHGARAKDGEGYVNLTDGKLTRSQLHDLLIDPPADPAFRFDTLHVIIDACSAYFLVHDRGVGVSTAPGEYSGHMGDLFGSAASPEKAPHVGYVLATTGDAKVHEWSAYRGGVFSHLVRSALSGAADVDLDGRVTYAELGAFIAAASGTIQDPRARLDVTVTPPPSDAEAPLTERNHFEPRQLVLLDPKLDGHYQIETEDGERLLDLNKAPGLASVFAVWGGSKYYLTGREGESVLDFTRKSVVASLSFSPARRGERGSIDQEYRKALFSRPYDYSFYRAYASLSRLPVHEPSTRPVLIDDLTTGEEPIAATPAIDAATPAPASGAKTRLAVLYFDYDGKSEELTVLRKGLAAMLIADLSASTELVVVERERLQEVLDELKLGASPKVDAATAAKIGKLLGAQYLVMGRYFDLKGTLMVTARAINVETGAVLRTDSLKAQGKPEDFLDLEQKLARELAGALANVTRHALPDAPARAPKKLAQQTAVRFSKALDAIDHKDKAGAKKELEAVVHEQPDFRLASAELSTLLR
jgi:TolB-like protein